jgi:hypothetical protein
LKIAYLNLRYTLPERRAMFERGLQRLGFHVEHRMPDRATGIFVTWNRIGAADAIAGRFEDERLPVLVTENASWGNEFAGQRWYHIARNRHNTAGMFKVGDEARWDRLGVGLRPWRNSGETVILPQRGIGSPPTAMPPGWASRHKGRVRHHPGQKNAIALDLDLANCGRAITWGSGAAIKALMWGIPVQSDMPDWIGQQDNTDAGRLAMFRRLAWAQWRHEEIASGEAFEWLLS